LIDPPTDRLASQPNESIYLRYNDHFSRWTCVSQYQNVFILDFIGKRMIEVVVATKTIRYTKLQSNRHHQQTNTLLF